MAALYIKSVEVRSIKFSLMYISIKMNNTDIAYKQKTEALSDFLRKTQFDFICRRPSRRVVRPACAHQVVERRWWTARRQRKPLSSLDLVNHSTVADSLERLDTERQDLPHTHRCTSTNSQIHGPHLQRILTIIS